MTKKLKERRKGRSIKTNKVSGHQKKEETNKQL